MFGRLVVVRRFWGGFCDDLSGFCGFCLILFRHWIVFGFPKDFIVVQEVLIEFEIVIEFFGRNHRFIDFFAACEDVQANRELIFKLCFNAAVIENDFVVIHINRAFDAVKTWNPESFVVPVRFAAFNAVQILVVVRPKVATTSDFGVSVCAFVLDVKGLVIVFHVRIIKDRFHLVHWMFCSAKFVEIF